MIKKPEDIIVGIAWGLCIGIAIFAIYAFSKYGVDPNHIYFSL